ncbi:serine/arginine-rich splicing factor SC35-like [Magnolia sinica]|uniref:serine/arginine-rich splicing factor SC35-like n=1 Tax=Magnolia sinica TaxID=86752 RepID=UPI00265A4BFA|nr:serine/arginine-rich splicing factor SC35-like [Magnolia sinica]
MEDLYRIFSKYRKVIDVYIPTIPGSLKPRGFRFARFRYEQEAKNAKDVQNGKRIDGRAVEIRWPDLKFPKGDRYIAEVPLCRGSRETSHLRITHMLQQFNRRLSRFRGRFLTRQKRRQ